jgi:eukaryotic-like serine/threonine-protein kinase
MENEDPLIGQLVAGRYRVIRRLGEGGMGQVYLGRHEAIEKAIALKVLKPEYSAKEDIVTRFQQEAISASRIKHPNVLEVFDFGQLDNGCAFLAMEFLTGNDLADELMERGYIETRRALRLMLQICRALSAAHKAGVVHRDMKPDNVFLLRPGDGDEIIKIVDFGIAQLRKPDEEAKSSAPRRRLTKTGMIFGTPEYMAPEQAAGRKADLRVDIYATGLILFEMLTGTVPFTGDSFMAVLAAHLNDPVPSMLHFRPELSISPELHALVARALSKNPDDRFQTMPEFAAALLATPEGQGLQAAGEVVSISVPPPAPGPGMPGYATRAQYGEVQSAPSLLGHLPNTAGTAAHGTPVSAVTPGAGINLGSRGGTLVTPSAGLSPSGRPATAEVATTTDGSRESKSAKSSLGLVLGLVGAVAVFGGGALWFARGMLTPAVTPAATNEWTNSAPSVQVPGEVQPVGAVAVVPAVTALPSSEAASTSSAVAAPTARVEPAGVVTLSVQTDPPGALLKKGGFQVCDRTPCEVELNTGDAVQLDAELGNKRGSTKVLAHKNQSVTITLRAPSAPKKDKLCEVNVGGLKILRPCPN